VVSALDFRCTGCGNCCRTLRVAVTALDVARLVRATARPARELVAWLAPDAVDMTGEPQSFVDLSEGRRLMVLAQRSDGCLLLGANDGCTAYAARPRDCRAFPFDFERSAGGHRLKLLPLAGCDSAADGNNDLPSLEAEDAHRWRELEEYQRLVAHWNRRVFHRRRLGKPAGTADAFLDFALTQADARC
jgi:Fe-S-cluster containining protein